MQNLDFEKIWLELIRRWLTLQSFMSRVDQGPNAPFTMWDTLVPYGNGILLVHDVRLNMDLFWISIVKNKAKLSFIVKVLHYSMFNIVSLYYHTFANDKII